MLLEDARLGAHISTVVLRRWQTASYQIPMLLWADPDMAITPSAKLPQFLYLVVCVLYVIFLRKAGRIIDANIAAETEEDPRALIGK